MRKVELLEETDEEMDEKDTGSRHIILPILLEILLLGILLLKTGKAALNYVYALIPLLLMTAVYGTRLYNHDGDMKLFGACASLTAIGTALQVYVDALYKPLSGFSLLKMGMGMLVAVIFVLLYALLHKLLKKSWITYVLMILAALIYIVLLFKGYDPNGYGTSAWISIGSITLQLTDVTKVAAVLFYASLFSTEAGRSDQKVLWLSNIFFLINLIGSVLIYELGSFFILFFLHLSILFIFMKKGKKKRIYLLVVFGLCAFAVGLVYVFHALLYGSAMAGTLPGFLARLWPLINKVYLRFSVTGNLELDPNGAGYQLLQGRKALWMSGLFGNTVNFHAIPVAESDMAFVALCTGFGFIFAFAVVGLFWRIWISGSELSRKYLQNSTTDAIVVYGMTVLIFMQAGIVILGSCNVIPFTGLPIPFLSRGGTYQAIVYSFSGLLLHMSESEVLNGGDDDDGSEEEIPDITIPAKNQAH